MLDQLILGCSHPEVQKTLIGKDEKLTLDQAANSIRTHEATRQQMTTLNKTLQASSAIHAVQRGHHYKPWETRRQQDNKPQPQLHNSPGVKITVAGAKKFSTARERGNSLQRDQSKSHDWNRDDRDRRDNHEGQRGRGRGRGRGRRRHKSNSRRSFHSTEEQNIQSDSETPNLHFEKLSFESISVDKLSTNGQKLDHVVVSLNSHNFNPHRISELKCKVDCGAKGNILPISTYRRLYPENLDVEGQPKPGVLQHNIDSVRWYQDTTAW